MLFVFHTMTPKISDDVLPSGYRPVFVRPNGGDWINRLYIPDHTNGYVFLKTKSGMEVEICEQCLCFQAESDHLCRWCVADNLHIYGYHEYHDRLTSAKQTKENLPEWRT